MDSSTDIRGRPGPLRNAVKALTRRFFGKLAAIKHCGQQHQLPGRFSELAQVTDEELKAGGVGNGGLQAKSETIRVDYGVVAGNDSGIFQAAKTFGRSRRRKSGAPPNIGIRGAGVGLDYLDNNPILFVHITWKRPELVSLRGRRRLGYNRSFAYRRKGLAETRCTKFSCTIPYREKSNPLCR